MREKTFSSRLGFIMSAVGAAVGLGNIWGFPARLGRGGAAFLAFYILFVIIMGFPLLLGELSLGRLTGKETVSALSCFGASGRLSAVCALCSCFLILSYYCFFGGMTFCSAVSALTGRCISDSFFSAAASDTPRALSAHFLFALVTLLVVLKGVRRGTERLSRAAVPLLLIMLAALCVTVLLRRGAVSALLKALSFRKDVSVSDAAVSALTQAAFSLSVGQGVMIVFGSSVSRNEDLEKSAFAVAAADTFTALLSACTLLPAAILSGSEPDAGAGLLFDAAPRMFLPLPCGRAALAVFFLLLLAAALTSSVSMLEALCRSFSSLLRLSRGKSAAAVMLCCAVSGVPVCLGFGALRGVRILGRDIFSFCEFLAQNVFLCLALLFFCVGARGTLPSLSREISRSSRFRARSLWRFSVGSVGMLLAAGLLAASVSDFL